MAELEADLRPRLLERMAAFDDAFSQDQASEMGQFFSTDACLMWPEMEDFVRRDAIQAAFEELIGKFTTIAWQPGWTLIKVFGEEAVVIGRFIEDRAPRAIGAATRVFGRLVEYWSLGADGIWRIDLALTSRYAEEQPLG